MSWLSAPAPPPDRAAGRAATARQATLTKPAGSLGRLEDLAVRLAAMQGSARPRADRVRIVVFAADHGVAEDAVSAYPQQVTAQMLRNFSQGGAAINVLAAQLSASLEVVDLGTATDSGALPGVMTQRIGPGTANFSRRAAMDPGQLECALDAGRAAAGRAAADGMDLFIGGEMGIGNTTSAAAIACALLGAPAATLAGTGSGLDADGLDRKRGVIARALTLHQRDLSAPLEVLRVFGGFEIAALVSAYIACAQQRMPIVVDGFISGCAALVACRVCAGAGEWMIHAHRSAEPGHRAVLRALDVEPVLDLGMRLGEGTGAALVVSVLRSACALHDGMATFSEAGIGA